MIKYLNNEICIEVHSLEIRVRVGKIMCSLSFLTFYLQQ